MSNNLERKYCRKCNFILRSYMRMLSIAFSSYIDLVNSSQIQTLGLTKLYQDDPNDRSAARKLMALALLPLNQVEFAFNDMVTDSPHCIQQLLNYFKTYWMTKVKLSLWNVAELDIRTNNNVDATCLSVSSIQLLFLTLFLLGWNSRFNKRVLKSHANVWSFIES